MLNVMVLFDGGTLTTGCRWNVREANTAAASWERQHRTYGFCNVLSEMYCLRYVKRAESMLEGRVTV